MCCLISDVSGTVRQCNTERHHGVKRCTTQNLLMPGSENRKIKSPSGQNEHCICYEKRCNNSPWFEWNKPTARRPTTHRPTTRRPTTHEQAVVTTVSLQLTDQQDVTWNSSDTPTDSKGIPLPTDSEGASLPTDSDEVPQMEESMSTQIMEGDTLPVNYNDHSTDKIQSNGVKALSDDMVLATSLILSIYIFC